MIGMTDNECMTIYDKRRDCIERWHLGDPAAANDMAIELVRLRAELAAARGKQDSIIERAMARYRRGLQDASEIAKAVADRFGTEDGFSAACCYNEIVARLATLNAASRKTPRDCFRYLGSLRRKASLDAAYDLVRGYYPDALPPEACETDWLFKIPRGIIVGYAWLRKNDRGVWLRVRIPGHPAKP